MRPLHITRSIIRRIWPAEPAPLILMYHRIADDPIDPWELSVSPGHFEEQLLVLRRTRHPIPLADFVRNLQAGTLRPDAVALTFDDGYVDNLVAGKPRLAAADIPATVFLATGYIDRPGEFWWDELARFILPESVPVNFELMVKVEGKHMNFVLGSALTRDGGASQTTFSTDRREVFTVISRALRRLKDEERELLMVKLRSIFSLHADGTARGRALTQREVGMLTSGNLITIGAHTVTHPVLSELECLACRREIVDSKLACEALIGAPVASFAYPFGDLNVKTRKSVMTAGFDFACSTRYGPTTSASDVFALPRVHIRNWNGDTFEQKLRHSTLTNA